MDFGDGEYGFGSGFPPAMVCVTPFPHSASPAPRRLSSSFTQPNEPVRAKRQLAWVSLQGRLVGAEEASSYKTIDPAGALGVKEATAWELFTPMQRVLTVAVAAAAAGNSEKNKQISKLQKSVELRDKVLLNMQQKLDTLCEQVNYFKDQPELPKQGNDLITKRADCDCKVNNSTKELAGEEEVLNCEVERDERRMSDLSDWAPSVTSSLDIQVSNVSFEHDINSLRKECEEKDITIKEMSTYIRSAEVLGSKRIVELEDMIRRKNTIINKLRKDIITLEQKVVNLTRLRRSSSASSPYSNPRTQPMLADNVLYDMDATTDPSSSDSDGSPDNRKQTPPSKIEKTSAQTSAKASDIVENLVSAKSCPPFVEQNHGPPHTKTPLKERISNQIPDSVPPVKPKRIVYAGGENRNRRPPVKSKEAAVAKRWV